MSLYIRVGSVVFGKRNKIIRLYQPLILEPCSDIAYAESFRNHKTYDNRIPVDQGLQSVARRHICMKSKCAALDFVLKAVQFRRQPELRLAVDHAALVQLFADFTDAHTGTNGKVDRCSVLARLRGCPKRRQKYDQEKYDSQHRNPEHKLFL